MSRNPDIGIGMPYSMLPAKVPAKCPKNMELHQFLANYQKGCQVFSLMHNINFGTAKKHNFDALVDLLSKKGSKWRKMAKS